MNIQNRSEKTEIFLGVGSNLGAKLRNLLLAKQLIEEKIGEVTAVSSVYQTEPWGYKNQPRFFNQCLGVYTGKRPHDVLRLIHQIEAQIGRKREDRWGKRIIDIDILFYDDLVIETKDIKIPHPYLHLRQFVLVPLSEIAPHYEHPAYLKTVEQIRMHCNDPSQAELLIAQDNELQLHRN